MSLADRDRPLTARGLRAARRMAELLAAHADPPRAALCSDAKRALDTLAAVRRRVALRCEIVPALLHCDAAVVAARIAAFDRGEPGPLLVVGHNPGLHDFVRRLAGSGRRRLRERLAERFPTAALAELELAGDAWSALAPGSARLADLVFPRDQAGGRP